MWIVAKKYKDIPVETINKNDILKDLISNYKVIYNKDLNNENEVVDKTINIIGRYQYLKQNGFIDDAFNTTWKNVQLNPQIIQDDPDLKTYLLVTADMLDTFYRWGKIKGYTTYDDVIEFFRSLSEPGIKKGTIGRKSQYSGQGVHDEEINFLQNKLDNPEDKLPFSTVELMKRRLKALKAVN